MGPSDCSREEWAARQQLAACYRVFHLIGWTELIYNHISLRQPDSPRHLLLNRFGLHYSEVRASNLVKVDLDGRVVDPPGAPVNAAGVAPHCAIHAGVPGAHCVMHTHTTAGMAVAASRLGLTHDNFYAAQLGGRVGTHDFEGITVRGDEGARLVAAINGAGGSAPKPALVLRNHGLLAWGPSVPEAFMLMWTLQRACDVQIASSAAGPLNPIRPEVFAQTVRESGPGEKRTCDDVFAAMQRIVDAKDPGYRN